MVLKCELKQVKHDTVTKWRQFGWGDVRYALIVAIIGCGMLVLKIDFIFWALAVTSWALSALAGVTWMRDVRKKCNARRERNVNKFGDADA